MKRNFNNEKTCRPAEIYKLIARIRDVRKRNLLRGYSAKTHVTSNDARVIRKANSPHDSMIAGALLKGYQGLLGDQKKKKTSGDLYAMTSFPPVAWRNEVCYTAGYVNSEYEDSIEMLGFIKELSCLEVMDSKQALELLLRLSEKHGASNFLSYKLAYLRSSRDLSESMLKLVSKIEDEILHRDNAGFHFSALENLSSKISLFVVAQRRISGLVGKVGGDFRKFVPLSNFIPTPLNEEDVAGFLLRATESCLLDTVYAILAIFNLEGDLGSVRKEFENRLDPGFLSQLIGVIDFSSGLNDGDIVTEYYRSQDEGSDQSLNLYRISSAFLERPKFAIYRNNFDRVIGARLLEEVIGGKMCEISRPLRCKDILLAQDSTTLNEDLPVSLDAFYRTFLFLRFLGDRSNLLSISRSEIKYIFENTIGLEMLLAEREMKELYVTAPPETKGFISVLALALFRKKSIDPDVDFEFRTNFIDYVNSNHDGSIVAFIDYLLSDSPQVANYIVESLDEVTLEKMYTLIKNSSQASSVRCEILQTLGQRLNRIEYIIEADAITTRSKVSSLIKYFDSSRMYVDSVSMKRWLDANPTISTEQYRSLYPRIKTRVSSVEPRGDDSNLLLIQLDVQGEYLVTQIAKEAFEQFCLNAEFGIESYLGRRIRHNTLDGVTADTVDAVLRKPEYRVVMSNSRMRRAADDWLVSYKSIIDKLRRDYLQFKPNGSLFKATVDLDESLTKENIRLLRKSLMLSGGCELLNDLVIAFCWNQISPQLENASRFIKTTLLREATASIDKYFSGDCGALEEQMKSDLHEALNEVFKKIADWFQVPQTGFVSATVKDLCQIIMIELHKENAIDFFGGSVNSKYTGISVHRLYDCLAVLLKNAHKHGEEGKPILVSANASRIEDDSVLDVLTVEVASIVEENYYMESKKRVYRAIESVETGIDMVTEGYTGIKKIKFITRTSEGFPTIKCESIDDSRMLKLKFTLHAERASEEGVAGEDP